MLSTNTYTEQKYCTYITHYSGDKMPQNYIGSTTVDKINNCYRGSVSSKQYKEIWKLELKQNPHLFSIEIISYHDTRPEALWKELQLQRMFNVVKNPLFVNKSLAKKDGCFGMTNKQISEPKQKLSKEEINNKISIRLQNLTEQGIHPFQQKHFIEVNKKKTSKRNKELAQQGLHPAQIWSKEGKNPFQSEVNKKKTSERNKELAQYGLNPSQLPHNKELLSIRSKSLIEDNKKRPIYLEVKHLCEEYNYKKPYCLHMKSDDFLLQLRDKLIQLFSISDGK